MRKLILGLLVLLGLVQFRLWAGEESLVEVRRLEQAIAAQRLENEALQARNNRLEAEVADLRTGTAAVEERARRDLGMIRRGEIFHQFVDG